MQRSGIDTIKPQLTQNTNGKLTNSHIDTTNESQEVSPFSAGDKSDKFSNYTRPSLLQSETFV